MRRKARKSDTGRTSLFSGEEVSKDDARVELDGTLDELSSFLGMSKSLIEREKDKIQLEAIQKDLFLIGAEVATTPRFLKRLKERIEKNHILRLEKAIKKFKSKKNIRRRGFCLPGASLASSILDISRAVVRRAERRAVTLTRKKQLENHHILAYLNRLSELLYLWARECEK